MARPWIVLKYGGTSVATAQRWQTIAQRAQALIPTHRVWIVASALSQVSNTLERAIDEAVDAGTFEAFEAIAAQHLELAKALELDADALQPCLDLLDNLRTLLTGIAQLQEASARTRARVMSFGELASTALGVAALRQAGLNTTRVDARDLLATTESASAHETSRYLAAEVVPRTDVDAAEAKAGDADVVLTQGFIARAPNDDTCLLGRGGSDTSATLFAALIGAERTEIWTDVHGMFTTDPRTLPSARLIRRIRFREAQELAAMGAKVLHPRCLGPAQWAGIPIEIRNTRDPDAEGTIIGTEGDDDPTVMAVVCRTGVPLVTVETLDMWGAQGFLAQVFQAFAQHGMSVDLVATSQSAVTVTLDHVPEGLGGAPFQALKDHLGTLGEVSVIEDSGVVSMVGRYIRTVLHELGSSFAAFEQKHVHLVSASSEDLNLSFVVDGTDAPRLVRDLHARLLGTGRKADWLGPTWSELSGHTTREITPATRWWIQRRDALLDMVTTEDGDQARYVYDLATVAERARGLTTHLTRVQRCYYAMKANSHPEVLKTVVAEGLGIECVSAAEVRFARELLGPDVPILFTPNFCPVAEYAEAYALGAEVTVDGPDVLQLAPEIFRGRDVAVRIDPGGGKGHHEKVTTAGARSKFGHPAAHAEAMADAVRAIGARVTGLHAHVGSGILDAEAWSATGETLGTLRAVFPEATWIDLGGGLGVVERPGQAPLDLAAVNEAIGQIAALDGIDVRMEPGRYLVSEAGVLLVPVTQVRTKGEITFVGGATGMNSLIRPALYGAWHGIHNLTKWGHAPGKPVEVVGPICETGDILGHDRALAPTEPGDVLIVENAGAYGAVMGSSYNMRPTADELVIHP